MMTTKPTLTSETPRREFIVQGAAAEYDASDSLEALCESGAGTGKSFSLLVKHDACAWEHPGSRILFVRRTRKSMNTAPLPEFEKEVLWPGHPALMTGAKHYKDRDFYHYPNGSEIWLAGFDSQEKIDDILSSKFDRIAIFQAEQIRLTDYEKLLTRLRAFNTPYHQITLDVNPAYPDHWIPKRFGLQRGTGIWKPKRGRAVFSYRHQDNPAWFDADTQEWTDKGRQYVGTILQGLTGVRRERLLKHRWVSAEGMIWEDYDPDVHVLDAEIETPGPRKGTALLHVRGWEKPVHLKWFAGSLDWGYDDPCAFGLYGFDERGRAFMIHEIYRTKQTHEDIAERIGILHKDFPMRAILVDNQPALVDTMNRWLSNHYGGRNVGMIVRPADKRRDQGEKAGIDIVRVKLRKRELFFRSDALAEVDPELKAREDPCSILEEIQSYVYTAREEGKKHREEPDSLCSKHGPDQLRYMAKWAWGKDLADAPIPGPELPDGASVHDWNFLQHEKRVAREEAERRLRDMDGRYGW